MRTTDTSAGSSDNCDPTVKSTHLDHLPWKAASRGRIGFFRKRVLYLVTWQGADSYDDRRGRVNVSDLR